MKAGKIRHVGLSNVNAARIEEALDIVPVVSVQNRCNVFDRRAWEEGVIEACEAHGIAFIPYAPLGGSGSGPSVGDDTTLAAVGRRHEVSPHEIALAWLLAKSACILPIPGSSRPATARSSAHAASISLTEADHAELDAAFPTA